MAAPSTPVQKPAVVSRVEPSPTTSLVASMLESVRLAVMTPDVLENGAAGMLRAEDTVSRSLTFDAWDAAAQQAAVASPETRIHVQDESVQGMSMPSESRRAARDAGKVFAECVWSRIRDGSGADVYPSLEASMALELPLSPLAAVAHALRLSCSSAADVVNAPSTPASLHRLIASAQAVDSLAPLLVCLPTLHSRVLLRSPALRKLCPALSRASHGRGCGSDDSADHRDVTTVLRLGQRTGLALLDQRGPINLSVPFDVSTESRHAFGLPRSKEFADRERLRDALLDTLRAFRDADYDVAEVASRTAGLRALYSTEHAAWFSRVLHWEFVLFVRHAAARDAAVLLDMLHHEHVEVDFSRLSALSDRMLLPGASTMPGQSLASSGSLPSPSSALVARVIDCFAHVMRAFDSAALTSCMLGRLSQELRHLDSLDAARTRIASIDGTSTLLFMRVLEASAKLYARLRLDDVRRCAEVLSTASASVDVSSATAWAHSAEPAACSVVAARCWVLLRALQDAVAAETPGSVLHRALCIHVGGVASLARQVVRLCMDGAGESARPHVPEHVRWMWLLMDTLSSSAASETSSDDPNSLRMTASIASSALPSDAPLTCGSALFSTASSVLADTARHILSAQHALRLAASRPRADVASDAGFAPPRAAALSRSLSAVSPRKLVPVRIQARPMDVEPTSTPAGTSETDSAPAVSMPGSVLMSAWLHTDPQLAVTVRLVASLASAAARSSTRNAATRTQHEQLVRAIVKTLVSAGVCKPIWSGGGAADTLEDCLVAAALHAAS